MFYFERRQLMEDTTLAGSSAALTRLSGRVDAMETDTALYLSPAKIAEVLSCQPEPPADHDVSLCGEVLRRLACFLAAPVATRLDYAPFALSRCESASLARLALEGTAVMGRRMGERGMLSEETVRFLTQAIAQATRELAAEAHAPVDSRQSARLSSS
jgi:hypothetical protein